MNKLVVTVLAILLPLVSSLSIINTTSAKQLTRLFTNESYSQINQMDVGYMTCYIDPNVPSKTLLWYGMNVKINDSSFTTFLKSEIFTPDLTPYSNVNNGRPFIIVADTSINTTNKDQINELFGNAMCTSPITNDIMTCWINVTWTSSYTATYQVDCRLFFVKTNILSDIIHITNDRVGYNIGSNLICFNDSYFVPYFHNNVYDVTSPAIIYGTLLDLKGNIVYNQRSLKNITTYPFGYLVQTFPTKGGRKFNPKSINAKATELLTIDFQTFNTSTNVSNVESLYAYYTNINDTVFPIYLYGDRLIRRNPAANADVLFISNNVLDYNANCCYIGVYKESIHNYNEININAMITDINGNNIKIKQYSDIEDVLLVRNVSDDFNPNIIDLAMISTADIRYFLVTFPKITSDYRSNTTIASVYSLEYDTSAKAYDLNNVGCYDTVQLQDAENEDAQFDSMWVYNLPNSNDLVFSWTQYGSTYRSQDIYAQTFEIN